MQAVVAVAFGGPEVLRVQTVPDPAPGPGQLLIAVQVSGVLWIDTVIRSGRGGPRSSVEPPYTPGAGAAGVVIAVGPDADRSWIGRLVLANVGTGGYAERVVADAGSVLVIPGGLSAPGAMALLHDGNTALALFESVRLGSNQSVLVQPAAGGAGNLLVQLACQAGARAVGGARGAEKLALVRRLGAELAVDYSVDGWPDDIAAKIGTVDIAFDGVGGPIGRAAFETVRRGGVFSAYGSPAGAPTRIDPDEAARRGVRVVGMEQLAGFAVGRMERVGRLLSEAAAGRITPTIGPTFPLDRADEAHAAIADREVLGKVLLTVEK